jgi:hypothetical protein
MRLLTKTLLLLAAAAALGASYEGALRLRAESPAGAEPAAHDQALDPAPGLPHGASWETLFNANWR